MQDRPTASELLTAIVDFLHRDVQPRLEGRTQYHLRVALNLAWVLRRELELEPECREREWSGLTGLDGLASVDVGPPGGPRTREDLLAANEALCEAIRRGTFDADAPAGGRRRDALIAHLRSVLADKLRIANPEFLERVTREAEDGATP